AITGVKFDKWHIASSSRDYYANVWSTQGTFDKPLTALRHPKEVLCLEFLYLRVITGCADGKIRIWNALSGACLRVMRGNSVSDPVTGLVVTLNRLLVNTKSSLLLMNFEPVNYDYTLEEDKPPITETSTSSILSASMNKRKHISVRQRQTSASSKLSTVSTQESIDEKKKGVTIASNKENNGGSLTLEETKELLKKQIRGDPEQKQSLIPAEFRKSQQAALYQTNKSQDDTIYSEHRPVPLKMTDRPPSSPSRFDLRKRMASSQSQFYTRPPSASDLTSTNTSISRFEIIHRPPSQNRIHISQTNTDVSSIFKSSSLDDEKVQLLQPQQKPDKPRLIRPRTSTTIPTYEVKRGSKIYKVVVGYVSPYTSPLQRKELNLKTDGEIDLIFKQIKKQQEIQRASQQQIWLGLSPQPTS
ncbi:unnamed protein product, partial [Adineta steineri]